MDLPAVRDVEKLLLVGNEQDIRDDNHSKKHCHSKASCQEKVIQCSEVHVLDFSVSADFLSMHSGQMFSIATDILTERPIILRLDFPFLTGLQSFRNVPIVSDTVIRHSL